MSVYVQEKVQSRASYPLGLQGLKDRIAAPLSKGLKTCVCRRAVISQLEPWGGTFKILDCGW